MNVLKIRASCPHSRHITPVALREATGCTKQVQQRLFNGRGSWTVRMTHTQIGKLFIFFKKFSLDVNDIGFLLDERDVIDCTEL